MRTLMEFERPCFGLVQSVGQGEFAALPLWMRNLGVGGAVAAAVGRLCSRVFVVSSACSCVRACVRVCVCVSGASLARDAPESVTAAVPSRPALLAPVAELGMPSDAPNWLAGWLAGWLDGHVVEGRRLPMEWGRSWERWIGQASFASWFLNRNETAGRVGGVAAAGFLSSKVVRFSAV